MQDGFLDVLYEGKLTIQEIINHGTAIANNSELPGKLRILTDGRKASYQFMPDDMEQKMIGMLKMHLNHFEIIKNAFIYTTPIETAMSFILEEQIPAERYLHRIFSSRQAALNWLLQDD